MNRADRFDPFNSRLCRNVRNALSESFRKALAQRQILPVQRVAEALSEERLPESVIAYLDHRMDLYRQTLADVRTRQLDPPLAIALAIWDRGLFFEMHEYLEPYWMAARGDEKRFLQALIRAAGAYVHLERGKVDAARRLAGKAASVLEICPERLAPFTSPRILTRALRSLDPVPPTLSGAVPTGPTV
jgi:hypothetical protein